LKNQDFKLIDEVSIFSAHEKLNKIAHESISKTNKAKRNLMRSYSRKSINKESNKTPVSTQSPFVSIVNVKNITPYED
jgi:hypothetical protein